jgi:hypothetical protein
MADLDTTSKRASAVQLMKPWTISPPLPDGTIDQGDRQHIAATYSGILAGTFVAPVANAVSEWIIRARRRGRR